MPTPVTGPSQPLDNDGPKVPCVDVVLMIISMFHPHRAEQERLCFLDSAWSDGQVFWNTVDGYIDSKDLLGIWFATNPDKRKDVFLTAKFGARGSKTSSSGAIDVSVDSTPEYCCSVVGKSLKRFGLYHVDL